MRGDLKTAQASLAAVTKRCDELQSEDPNSTLDREVSSVVRHVPLSRGSHPAPGS
jgi:hypothetical protein